MFESENGIPFNDQMCNISMLCLTDRLIIECAGVIFDAQADCMRVVESIRGVPSNDRACDI